MEVENVEWMFLDARWREANRVIALSLASRFSVKMNRFVDNRVDSLSLKTFEDSKSLSNESTLFFIESIRFLPESKRLFLKPIRSWLESTRSILQGIRVDSDGSRIDSNPFRNQYAHSRDLYYMFHLHREPRSRGAYEAKSGPSGVVSRRGGHWANAPAYP
ncbi:hypothetical protein PIB30_020826 [Stylosanthes scabra]|uniref:Uncharacterized protein n=1 Tax=Stylosanthes scabra TaxID=79078 RepID=A0ABU6U804_9FABA|nr:hypothetical protein [Stylosanthes scabra]